MKVSKHCEIQKTSSSFRQKLDLLDLMCPLPPPKYISAIILMSSWYFRDRASDGSLATSQKKTQKKKKKEKLFI